MNDRTDFPDEEGQAEQEQQAQEDQTEQETDEGKAAANLAVKIFEFLAEKFDDMHTWVRTFAYIVFLGLFVHIVVSIFSGSLLIKGMLTASDKKIENISEIDVMVNTGSVYGVDNLGRFQFPVKLSRYYYILSKNALPYVTHKFELTFYLSGEAIGCLPTKTIGLGSRILPTIRLDNYDFVGEVDDQYKCKSVMFGNKKASAPSVEDVVGLFIGTAHADETLVAKDRLFLDMINIDQRVKSVVLTIPSMNYTSELYSTWSKTIEPIDPNDYKFSADSNYFRVPEFEGAVDASISITYKNGFWAWSEAEEKIDITLTDKYGDQTGAQNELIGGVELKNPYDVTIFEKTDIEATQEEITQKLIESGFNVRVVPSFLSKSAETNSVFTAKNVEVDAISDVLDVLQQSDVELKKIQADLNLKSGNPFEIQIGGSTAASDNPIIEDSFIEQLKNSKDIDQFNAIAEPTW